MAHYSSETVRHQCGQSELVGNKDDRRALRTTEPESDCRSAGKRGRRRKRHPSMMGHKNTCSTIELKFPEVSQHQLVSLTDFLAELLVEERLSELDQSSGLLLKGATICS
jgi:hypothetical protein